jgi:uncharacterized protein YjiS (DUF1127 family)
MSRSALSTMTFLTIAAVEQATRSLVRFTKALRHRREIKNLEEFDDRMLKDIGLTRGDVSSALDEPLLRNPSWVLVRSAERHSRAERPDRSAHQIRPVVPMVTLDKRCA